jgi:hypothetical protein
MHDWNSHLIADISQGVYGDPFWEEYISRLTSKDKSSYNLHLAVMIEPFLTFVLDGTKTVESRFSVNRCAPFDRVESGDVILLKRSGGPIVGMCQVAQRWFYHLDPESWQTIRKDFTRSLCAQDPKFWKDREKASYATLMRIRRVRALPPIRVEKRDRRGWVVLRDSDSHLPLWGDND